VKEYTISRSVQEINKDKGKKEDGDKSSIIWK
jgi:hypothetical protein